MTEPLITTDCEPVSHPAPMARGIASSALATLGILLAIGGVSFGALMRAQPTGAADVSVGVGQRMGSGRAGERGDLAEMRDSILLIERLVSVTPPAPARVQVPLSQLRTNPFRQQ